MARMWLSIRVDPVAVAARFSGRGPGRIFAAARRHTFARLAGAIDDAFSRCDRAHLHDWRTRGPRSTTVERRSRRYCHGSRSPADGEIGEQAPARLYRRGSRR